MLCFTVVSEARNTHVPLPLRHNGPVWQVAWAHPKFGHILASCSYDGRVLIWKEQASQQASASASWTRIKEHTLHSASGARIPALGRPHASLTCTYSELRIVGTTRTWCYGSLCLIRRKALRLDFQKWVTDGCGRNMY